jgi:nucleotide-binding universal stress UspA family protein
MKIIVGVDTQDTYLPALHLLARIGFQDAEIRLVHAADDSVPFPVSDATQYSAYLPDYVELSREAGHEALGDAKEVLGGHDLASEAIFRTGSPPQVLMEVADSEKADLVAVGTEPKGKIGALFVGGVGRTLTIAAHQSVLVAKNPVPETGPLRIVLAADHSEYGNRCIDRFLAMRPKGVERITVASAYRVSDFEASILRTNLPMLGGQVEEWLEEELTKRCKQIVDKLVRHGYQADHTVLPGHPNDVLRQVMTENKADLLVLGARGHGFLDRLLIGSISLHQVVAEPHSVLVIRAA